MPRIRNIKPEYFDAEEWRLIKPLEESLAAQVLFAGLWTQADREGRLKDEPGRLKSRIFGQDDEISVERVDALLDVLVKCASSIGKTWSDLLP